jgi:hypothetical protein
LLISAVGSGCAWFGGGEEFCGGDDISFKLCSVFAFFSGSWILDDVV